MGILSIFSRKNKYRSDKSHVITEEDRELSAEVRRMKKQIALEKERLALEKQKLELEKLRDEIEDYRYERDGEDEDIDPVEIANNPDSLMEKMIMTLLMANQNRQQNPIPTPAPTPTYTPSPPTERVLSQEDIVNIWSQLPSQAKKMLKKADSSQVRTLVTANIGNISEESHKNVFEFIKAQ